MNINSLYFLRISIVSTLVVVILGGCRSTRQNYTAPTLSSMIEETPLFKEYHFGFLLYDLEDDQIIHEVNSHNYFTPASNTKIYTLNASIKYLGDSTITFYYKYAGDSLIIWGAGDPTFLHPDFDQNLELISWLQDYPGKLVYSDAHFTNPRFGAGWAWDDYFYNYSQEISPAPMYGNQLRLRVDSLGKFSILPQLLSDSIQFDRPSNSLHDQYFRQENNNQFYLNLDYLNQLKEKQRDIPLRMNTNLVTKMLSDTLKREIYYSSIPFDSLSQPVYNVPLDTVYRRMMKQSDNFIAEQLLLQVGLLTIQELNTSKTIKWLASQLRKELPDELIWRDGSGLSRYNLFTPANSVSILKNLYNRQNENILFSLFPTGGEEGTLKDWYSGPMGQPFVYAKTGTLSNNHSLSGYLITDSGRRMIFSFMHNNYPYSSTRTKSAMQPILNFIRENY